MSRLTAIITAQDQATRDQGLDAFCHSASLEELLTECRSLEDLRHTSGNLYEQVRALFFLYAINRFHIPTKHGLPAARTDFVRRVRGSSPSPFRGSNSTVS